MQKGIMSTLVIMDKRSVPMAALGRKVYLGTYGKLILNPSKSAKVRTKRYLGVIVDPAPRPQSPEWIEINVRLGEL